MVRTAATGLSGGGGDSAGGGWICSFTGFSGGMEDRTGSPSDARWCQRTRSDLRLLTTADWKEVMPGSPENIPLGECPLSRSKDQLTPPSRTESTVFTLSRSESLWTAEASRGSCEVFWLPVHLMSTGGSFLLCGFIISGLYFAGHCSKVTNILGPVLVSIGLMVLVVGVVLVPITKENRQKSGMKKPLGYYRPPALHL